MRRTYLAAYERRRRRSASRLAFTAPEPAALAGLALVRGAYALPERRQPGAYLRDLSRELVRAGEHSAAVDIAGVAWVEGYGSVPMAGPPIEQVEWTIEHGAGPGAVRGPIALAWRTTFLASAWPLLGWERRRAARTELERRLAGLPGAVAQFTANVEDETAVSLGARLAFAAAEASERTGSAELAAAVSALGSALARFQRSDGSVAGADGAPLPTAVLCQYVAALRVAGDRERAERALAFLLERRYVKERRLLLASDEPERFELSPWVLLSLPEAEAPSAGRSAPRRLRELVPGGPAGGG